MWTTGLVSHPLLAFFVELDLRRDAGARRRPIHLHSAQISPIDWPLNLYYSCTLLVHVRYISTTV